MSRFMFRLEDHFYAMAEKHQGDFAGAIWRGVSNFFAFAGDVLNIAMVRSHRF